MQPTLALLALFAWQISAHAVDAQWYADNVPEGHWVVISNNLASDVDPCPSNNCAYSGVDGSEAMVVTWTGGAFADNFGPLGSYLIGPGGGHNSHDGDHFQIFDMATREWRLSYQPTSNPAPYSNGTNTGGRPAATHTYGNQGYHPTYGGPKGAYILFTAANTPGSGARRVTHVYDLNDDDGTWTKLDSIPGGHPTGSTAVWDPNRSRFWLGTGTSGSQIYKINPLASSGSQVQQVGNMGLNEFMAAIDPTRDIMVVLNFNLQNDPGNMIVTDLSNPDDNRVASVSGTPSGLNNTNHLGFEWCPPLDGFVAYKGKGTSQTLLLRPPSGNPLTGTWTWTTLNATGGVTPQAMENSNHRGRIRTRWQWVDELNLFVIIQRYNGPVYAYRPPGVQAPGGGSPSAPLVSLGASPSSVDSGASTTLSWTVSNANSCTASGGWSGSKATGGGSQVISNLTSDTTFTLNCTGDGGTGGDSVTVTINSDPDPDPDPDPNPDADADWQSRSSAPGVTFATRFDTQSEVAVGVHPNSNADHVTWTTDLKTSGNGALKFDILKTDTTDHGNWKSFFKEDESNFEAGDQFYLQFRQYFPRYLIEHEWEHTGGQSTHFKQSILSRASGGSNTPWEVVLTSQNRGYPFMYHQDGVVTADGLSVSVSTACQGSDFRYQNEIDWGSNPLTGVSPDGDAWTACEQDRARWGGLYSYTNQGAPYGPADPITGAVTYPLDGWMTFLQRVKLNGGYGAGDNELEVWVARDGEPYIKIMSKYNTQLGNKSSSGEGFNGFWLLPYTSRGIANPSREDTFTVYDEVIVSTDFIPAPGFASTSGPLPSVNLSASSTTVLQGGSAVLSWTSTNADSCTASGDWSGTKAVSGSQSVGPLDSNSTFVLTCTNAEGTGSDTVSVGVTTPPDENYDILQSSDSSHSDSFALNGSTVDDTIYAFVDPDTNIDQVSFYIDDTDASGTPFNVEFLTPFDFGGGSGFDTTQLSNGQHSLSAEITLNGGGSDFVTVNFNVQNSVIVPPPTVSLSATNVSVAYNGFSTLQWSSTDATSCEASGDWSGSQAINGSQAVGPLTADSTYILVCTGAGGSASSTVTVLVGDPPAPTVSVSASPSSVPYEGASQVIWSSTNATSCTASGDWSGARGLSGSENVGPLLSNANYTLTCTGAGGSASDTTSVAVGAAPLPVVNISATPNPTSFNGAATLTWSTLNTTSCTATGGWAGSRPLNGSLTVGPLTDDTVFGLTCTGNGGTDSGSVTVAVDAAPAPQLTLSANPTSVNYQGVSTLSWSSTDTTSCTASGDWVGARGTSGSESTGPLTADGSYTLTCNGPGGNVTRNATVTVGAAPVPTINFSANPSNVDFDGASTLTWTTANATSCTASGDWSGGRALNGSTTVGPLQSDTNYVLTCTGAGGNETANVTVTVNDPPPTVVLSAQPDSIAFNGNTTLTWSSQNAASCTASGDWSGARATSGSEAISALTADATFTLTCTGTGGSDAATAIVTVAAQGDPSLSLQASPTSVASGGSSVLTWNSTDVDTCTASGDWSGTRAVSGTESVGPLSADATFALTCTGTAGNVTSSTTVTIIAPQPTVSLTATPTGVDFGGSVVLGWTTTDADSCTAFGGWSGAKATSGGQQIDNLTQDTDFVLVCTGSGGQSSDTVSVTVGASPAPGITLQANPSQVDVGGSATLSWSVTDATGCDAAGAWSGQRSLSGSEQVGPISVDSSYSLVCSGPGGQSIETVLVQVSADAPTVTINAVPQSVSYDASTVINWSSTGADSCTAFGSWSGSRATSGSETVSNLTKDSEFIMLCSGPGGSDTQSVLVTVGAPPAPTVTIIADPDSVAYEGSSTISWTTEDATECTSFGSWSGDRATEGAEVIGPLTTDSNFILLCTGPGGSTARSAQVAVALPPAPEITLSATPNEIGFGASSQLNWSTEYADSCTASGGWSGSVAMQGTQDVGPLYATTSYTLVCSGDGGSASRSVSVIVASAADLPLQGFEEIGVGASPSGWYQSAANFSQAFSPFTFVVEEFNANNVLTIDKGGQNFHSHYLLDQADLWSNYRYTGRMYITSTDDRTGVTVMSAYPVSDAYYALSYDGSGAFGLTARGTSCSGDVTTGVTPTANTWYRFSVEAETTDSATLVRGKVWVDGQSEPGTWQAQCQDTSSGRLPSGSVGLRGGRDSSGNHSRWDDLLVVPLDSQVVAPPLLSLSATPNLVGTQGFSTIAWETSNAQTCTASGDWSGARATSGSELIGPLTVDSSFTLVCEGEGGSTSRSVAVAVVDDNVAPTVEFSANPEMVPTGGSTILSWNATNAAICAASGDWSGVRAPAGTEVIAGIVTDSHFQLNCIGPGGNVAAELDVLLSDIPRDPELDFTIDFGLLPVDGHVTLRWESRHTDTCTASGDWSGDKPKSGSEIVGPIVVSATYTLTCEGRGGTVSGTRSVSYEDVDADGMPDVWEIQYFGSLDNNGQGDSDGDGLSDKEEYTAGTNPFLTDTDGDGDSDFDEVQFGSNPLDPTDTFGGNRPDTPVLADSTDLPLWGFTANVTNGFADVNGDALASSEWEFALDNRFTSIVFARTVDGSTACAVPAGVMDPGVTYHVRTRHRDASGVPSLWSEPATMTASTSYPNDADGDGVDDNYQAPADADANGNGVADADEGLCNLYDAEGRSLVGFETNSGVVRCYRSVPNSDLPSSATITGDMPYGTFSFRIEGLLADPLTPARVFVTVWLPEALDPQSGWVIYDPAAQSLVDFSSNVTYNGNRAILTYTDGGLGDKDGIVNGIIVDPSGPLVVAAAPPPPPPPPPAPPDNNSGGGGGGGAPAPWTLLALGAALTARRWRQVADSR